MTREFRLWPSAELLMGGRKGRFRRRSGPDDLSSWTFACDPLRKWGAGRATEHCSNMNVINVSAKKAETRSGASTVT
jgi:hypothetical protein